jgi:hypothetical protein
MDASRHPTWPGCAKNALILLIAYDQSRPVTEERHCYAAGTREQHGAIANDNTSIDHSENAQLSQFCMP